MLFYILYINVEVLSDCAMYGQCNYNSTRDTKQNCYQEKGTVNAVKLNTSHEDYEEAIADLKLNCPYYFYDDDGSEIGKSLFVFDLRINYKENKFLCDHFCIIDHN